MPPITLNQAAKEAVKSKSTILEAIRSGRLSARKDEQGRYQIDPAELFRVYPPFGQQPNTGTDADPQQPNTETAFFERIIAGLESERDDLRRRLDEETTERREAQAKLTALLTHQPQPTAWVTQATVRPAFWIALALVLIFSAATWPWWAWLRSDNPILMPLSNPPTGNTEHGKPETKPLSDSHI